jgi:hypothetical protein
VNKKANEALKEFQVLGRHNKKKEGFAGKRFWSAGPSSLYHRGV